MSTPIENPQGCAHRWEDATSLHDKRLARGCIKCGRLEHYGGPISDGERAEAMATVAIIRAQRMAGLPGYYPDEEAPDPTSQQH